MVDMMNNVAPAAPVASAPVDLSNDGVNSAKDIFAEFERKLGYSQDEQMDDLSKAKKYEDKSVEDLYGEFNGEKTGEELVDGAKEGENVQQTQQTEEKPSDEFKYEFKGKVGSQEKELAFNNKQELDNWIKKGYVADVLYTKNKELQQQVAEAQQYKEGHEFAQRFDKMVAENPQKVLEAIIEDMDEGVLSQWLIEKAEHLSRDPKEREYERRLKEAEMIKQQMAEMRAEREQIEQQRVQSAQEADRYAVQTWGESILGKVKTSLPEEHYPIMEDVLRSSLLEGKHMQANGEVVTIKTLDKIFARRAKPLIDLIKARGVNQSTVNAKVGETIAGKKQDGLSRIQQATSSAQRSSKPPMEDANISKMFDSLIDGVSAGRYKMRQ